MPNNYSLNFAGFWSNMLPPNKRLTKYLAWGRVLLTPLQWLRDRLFNDYKNGTTYTDYNAGTGYVVGDFFKWTDKGIYFCFANAPIGTTPLDTNYFYKTQDSFVGITERMSYNSQKLVFEYALNKWFGQTFVNPPSTNPIYITNNTIDMNSFLVGSLDTDTAYAVLNDVDARQFVGSGYSSNNQYAFTIHYPIGLPATLGITDNQLKDQISAIANGIKLSGTRFNIVTP